jgi:hypothetical protein
MHVTRAVDTGANITMVSDAEATRLGLAARGSGGKAHDLAGGAAAARTAVARRVVIGQTKLSDVSLLVLPADQMPWKELAPGRQGILGLPVVIALDALRWTREGKCFTGSAARENTVASGPPNLRYDGLSVLTDVAFEGRQLDFILDTGNAAGTQFWERFGKDFAALVNERGSAGTVRVTQIGGANDRDTVVIPDVHLGVGGKDAVLAQANIFSKPVGDSRHYGLLGMDVLGQAHDVSIDFRSMTLRLH